MGQETLLKRGTGRHQRPTWADEGPPGKFRGLRPGMPGAVLSTGGGTQSERKPCGWAELGVLERPRNTMNMWRRGKGK